MDSAPPRWLTQSGADLKPPQAGNPWELEDVPCCRRWRPPRLSRRVSKPRLDLRRRHQRNRRILIKGGYVASLDKSVGDLPVGDVLIDGAIDDAMCRSTSVSLARWRRAAPA